MPSPLLHIPDHPGKKNGITLYLKRDDLIHPVVQGNKWRKLEPLIRALQSGAYEGILTYGGPFSNHIHAVAAAGQAFGFPTVAVVRGRHADLSNSTLAFARSCGMTLLPVSKADYDLGNASPEIQAVIAKYPNFYLLPEGGATVEAVRNCAGIAQEILAATPDISPEHRFIAIPAGTGSTAAGVIGGLGDQGTTLVFPVADRGLSAAGIRTMVEMAFEIPCPTLDFRTDYIFGGFATFHRQLVDFARDFLNQTGVLLDPIYTSKMMWGVFDLLEQGRFPSNSTVIAVHTGGLQGWEGFNRRYR